MAPQTVPIPATQHIDHLAVLAAAGAITLVILRITWQSFETVRADDGHAHEHEPATTPAHQH